VTKLNPLPDVLADCIALMFSSPPTGTLRETIASMLKNRLNNAREIFIEELKQGDRSPHEIEEIDEVASMFYRYIRAAQEGVARLNLQLMAQAICSLTAQRPIYPSSFLQYADLLTSLSREEVISLGTLYRMSAPHGAIPLVDSGVRMDVSIKTRDHLASIFGEHEALATLNALTRTGLVLHSSAYPADECFYASARLKKLTEITDFKRALDNTESAPS